MRFADNARGSGDSFEVNAPLSRDRLNEYYVSNVNAVGEKDLRAASCSSSQTPVSLSVAPPSYGTAHQRILQRIDELQYDREHREEVYVKRLHTLEAQLLCYKQSGETQRLQLQEQQECSLRLQKENTVLSTRVAELQDQLGAVGDLCLRRGRALQKAGIAVPSADAPPAVRTSCLPSSPSGIRTTTGAPPNSFSMRSMVTATAVNTPRRSEVLPVTGTPHGRSPHLFQYHPAHTAHPSASRDDVLNRSDGPSFDYNDLIPITKEDLDPDFLAALQAPEASSVAQVLALTEEVQGLRDRLTSQRAAYEQERAQRTVDERNAHQRFSEEGEASAKAVKRLEEMNEYCLRDLVTYQRNMEPKLRGLQEETERLKHALQEALQHAEAFKQDQLHTLAYADSEAATKYKRRMTDLKQSMQLKVSQLQSENDALTQRLLAGEEKSGKLEAELQRVRTALRKETTRYQLEKEGAESELQLMRQSLRQLEKKMFFSRAREEYAAKEEVPLSKYYLA